MSSLKAPFDPAVWNRHALLTCAEMRQAEEVNYTQGVPSYDLMRRAGEAVAQSIQQRWKPCRVLALCGPGNNGGDGFVAAEYLRCAGWDVIVAAAHRPDELKGDAARAANDWRGKTQILTAVVFDQAELVIDALFGAGLTRPIEGVFYTVLEKLARTKIPVVSIDLPSGIQGDTGEILGIAPQATMTIAFFRRKLGHVLLPGAKLCGTTIVADIGIAEGALQSIAPGATENGRDLWIDQFPFPQPEGHKYSRGHALIMGGALMTGAARLAARAAQRMGAGLVTLAAPERAIPIYAEALESAIIQPAGTGEEWKGLLDDTKRNAVLIGPGLGIGQTQADYVLMALDTHKPCVLDADALGNFTQTPDEFFAHLHAGCVLTPHEGEFARLFGRHIKKEADKLTRARKAAEIAGCLVLLKGADTVIADSSGYSIINVNAPPWLAVAGAGDVLAGMILGLLAQGVPIFKAAAAAAWLHGQAAINFGPGLVAEDLVSGLPPLLKSLFESKKSV